MKKYKKNRSQKFKKKLWCFPCKLQEMKMKLLNKEFKNLNNNSKIKN